MSQFLVFVAASGDLWAAHKLSNSADPAHEPSANWASPMTRHISLCDSVECKHELEQMDPMRYRCRA